MISNIVTLVYFLMIRRPPRSPLFPYPTLCRSEQRAEGAERRQGRARQPGVAHELADRQEQIARIRQDERRLDRSQRRPGQRSEEHTSELQSRQYLVCRLLLEKKNPNTWQ